MRIAILGTGRVGQALGAGWARVGHRVTYGSREPQGEHARAAVAAAGVEAAAMEPAVCVAGAEVAVLAVPWGAAQAVVTAAGPWMGQVLIDATNPIAPGLQLAVGGSTSGAELVAGWAPGARVVKAFNTTGWENMANPNYPEGPVTMFLCGDDAAARAVATRLAQDLGFDVADLGGLAAARFLEPMALAWITLARSPGRGVAFRLARR